MARYRRIARISRSKGLSGHVMAVPLDDRPLQLKDDMRLWVVPPSHGLIRETRVLSVAARDAQALLALEGVTTRATAQRLEGRYLLALAKDCDEEQDNGDKDGRGAARPSTGMTVIDERHGLLGTIVEERQGVAQALWVIDGPFGEVLIPVVKEFIRTRDATTVTVVLPPGLLELNR
ncbi:MAG: hypothetical protein LBH56_01540 [Coriobacteriales bacterium]|nr:hypothetical protein [Coriobacteriales bacterium]